MSLGQRIRELRREKNLTQSELGKLLNKTKNNISQYETDKRSPDPVTLQRLAEIFNTSTDYLLGCTDIRETPEQRIKNAIQDDEELLEFWEELSKREDLKLLFKQVRPLDKDSIQRIIRVIKAIEDEEQRNQ